MKLIPFKTPAKTASRALTSKTRARYSAPAPRPIPRRGSFGGIRVIAMEVVVKRIGLWAMVALLGAVMLGVPAAASAQDDDATTYDFDDDLVSGDLVRPDGELLNVRRRGRRASLIRIREHFVPEMLKSVEDL